MNSILEEKEEVLKKIKEFSENNIVVVEGKKDVEALSKHEIKSNPINGDIYLFAEEISKNFLGRKCKVLILTDFDFEGKKLRMKLKRAFSKFGVEEQESLRLDFKKVFKLSHIEGLS